MTKNPKVFVGVCTGPSKWYAAHYMIAALRNLDYDNLEIHFAVTHFGDGASDKYLRQITDLVDTVEWNCPVHIHRTNVDPHRYRYCRVVENKDEPDKPSLFPFDMVLTNLRKLRGVFLDGDCDYFLEVGGDNPPNRGTIKRLMRHGVDCAAGICYQRPRENEPHYPLVWSYTWQLGDLPGDLEPELKADFRKTFTHTSFLIPLQYVKNWRRKKTIKPYVGGTGMVLIKRHVLEHVGWHMPPSLYFTEDLYFFHQCNAHGFSTLGDLREHVLHFHDDGFMY